MCPARHRSVPLNSMLSTVSLCIHLYACILLGHSKLIWSTARVCFSMIQIYEDYALICVNFRGGNDCCVVLKNGTEFYAFADLRNTFHHPPRLPPQCSRRTFCYITKTTVATKGIILHNYAIPRFRKGLT